MGSRPYKANPAKSKESETKIMLIRNVEPFGKQIQRTFCALKKLLDLELRYIQLFPGTFFRFTQGAALEMSFDQI